MNPVFGEVGDQFALSFSSFDDLLLPNSVTALEIPSAIEAKT
jgi:hypothetical protein